MDSRCIPLIVGITGPRNLHPEDANRACQQLEAFLGELNKDYPHTPILLLSPLGEGADRLAARVADEMKDDRVQFGAVLPWPDEVCDERRHRSGDPEEFQQLLARAGERRICLPLPEGISAEALCSSEPLREHCFESVGKYLTRHCQILIALWDGEKSETSQTWRMIGWHLEGAEAPFVATRQHLDEPEPGPIYQIPIRRAAAAVATDASSAAKADWLRDPVDSEPRFRQTMHHLDKFNRDIARHAGQLAAKVAQAKSYVLGADDQKAVKEQGRDDVLFALDRFGIADQLSLLNQVWSVRLLVWVLGLILLTVTSFEVYAHVLLDRWEFLLAYPVLFIVGYVFVKLAKKWRVYNRYIDYRALAEAMRVHLFWKLAGLNDAASDFYLRSYRSQIDWIRVAIRSWSVESGEHDCACGIACETKDAASQSLELVRKNWIADQQKYFQKSAGPRNQKSAADWRRNRRIFLGVSLLLAAVQILRLLFADPDHHIGHDHLTHALIVAIALCGVLAGLCHEYGEKRLFEKQHRSYRWMAGLFKTALTRFNNYVEAGETDNARELVRELGCEALAENADWVIYHREHEPEWTGH